MISALVLSFTIGFSVHAKPVQEKATQLTVVFGDKTTDYNLELKKKKPTLNFKNNQGKSKSVLLSKGDVEYFVTRLVKLAPYPDDVGPCPRANLQLQFGGPNQAFSKQACLNSGSPLAKELISIAELLTGIL